MNRGITNRNTPPPAEPIRCPGCTSEKVIPAKQGLTFTAWSCTSCGRRFDHPGAGDSASPSMQRRPFLRRCLRHTDGQDLIEYALLAAFISLVAYGAVGALGESVNAWFDALGSHTEEKRSNCGPTGMAHSMGKCHGG